MLAGVLQVHEGQVGPVDPDPDAPPLPGGAAEIVRFFMDVPQWIQIGGVAVGGIAGVVLLVMAVRNRKRLVAGLVGLPAAVKASALAVLVAVGAVASIAGYQVYDFVEYDNRFCTGCHVMADAYVRFEASPHADLGCKDCHAQPRSESARQLYLWVVERPHEVGPHSPVPDARCTSCHIDGDPVHWPQIAASMGHRVHFDSDDPELGELMCVTCHGVEVHEFSPAEATCGGCHEAEATVRLGRMATETELHCVACHDFLRDEPATLPGVPEGMAMLPERAQCLACHDMTGILIEEEFDQDPHGAVCGACHNPHTQDTPADAVGTCQGCHEDSEALTIFHTGTHAPIHPQCTECHTAHSWSVDGTDCLSCHTTVMDPVDLEAAASPGAAAGPPFTAPAGSPAGSPFAAPGSSTAGMASPAPGFPALQLIHGAGEFPVAAGANGPAPRSAAEVAVAGMPAGVALPVTLLPTDTLPPETPRPFLHRQHQAVSCIECHGRADEHGVVTVRTARDCAACHHAPARGYDCADCHGPAELGVPRSVAAAMNLTVWDESRSRDLNFEHERHDEIQCQECHTAPVLLAVELECAACHDDHHRPEADCASCHAPAEEGVHGLEVHLTCTSSGCHAGTAGERPALTRTLCLTCHQDQRDHEPGLSCQGCHMVPLDPPLRWTPGMGSGAATDSAIASRYVSGSRAEARE